MVENKGSKQVFCRFLEKDVVLKKGDNSEEWVCKVGKECTYWNEEYIDEKVMIAPTSLKALNERDIVIICRHFMACRGNS